MDLPIDCLPTLEARASVMPETAPLSPGHN